MCAHRARIFQKKPEQAAVDCLILTGKHERGTVTVWVAIASHGRGALVVLSRMITSDHHQRIFLYHLHSMLQTLFPGERLRYQEENVTVHTSRCVQTWLHEHYEVEHLTLCLQSPDLNIIECLLILYKELSPCSVFHLRAHFLNSRRPCTTNGCECQ
ncbi:transposable element Tcb1 transposase [Trichonephila clavipes]|nr:transposable element Tcb1 transposase [Trichonephila clavipes]